MCTIPSQSTTYMQDEAQLEALRSVNPPTAMAGRNASRPSPSAGDTPASVLPEAGAASIVQPMQPAAVSSTPPPRMQQRQPAPPTLMEWSPRTVHPKFAGAPARPAVPHAPFMQPMGVLAPNGSFPSIGSPALMGTHAPMGSSLRMGPQGPLPTTPMAGIAASIGALSRGGQASFPQPSGLPIVMPGHAHLPSHPLSTPVQPFVQPFGQPNSSLAHMPSHVGQQGSPAQPTQGHHPHPRMTARQPLVQPPTQPRMGPPMQQARLPRQTVQPSLRNIFASRFPWGGQARLLEEPPRAHSIGKIWTYCAETLEIAFHQSSRR